MLEREGEWECLPALGVLHMLGICKGIYQYPYHTPLNGDGVGLWFYLRLEKWW